MCIRCETNKFDKIFTIERRGYGSDFDLESIEIPLCETCIKKLGVKEEWFSEMPDIKGEYQFEEEIKKIIFGIDLQFINTLTNICSSTIIK